MRSACATTPLLFPASALALSVLPVVQMRWLGHSAAPSVIARAFDSSTPNALLPGTRLVMERSTAERRVCGHGDPGPCSRRTASSRSSSRDGAWTRPEYDLSDPVVPQQ